MLRPINVVLNVTLQGSEPRSIKGGRNLIKLTPTSHLMSLPGQSSEIKSLKLFQPQTKVMGMRFDGRGYRAWKSALVLNLKACQLWYCVTPGGKEMLGERYPDDPEAWATANNLATLMAWESLSDDLRPRYAGYTSDFASLMSALDVVYMKVDTQSVADLTCQIGRKLSEYGSLKEFLVGKQELFGELDSRNATYSDEMKWRMTVNCVDDPHLMAFCSGLRAAQDGVHTFREVIAKLEALGTDQAGVAFAVRRGTRDSSEEGQKCTQCHKAGHKWYKCPEIICKNCNEKGHTRRHCQNKENVAYSWYLDSGAFFTMTPNRNDIDKLETNENMGWVYTAGNEKIPIKGKGNMKLGNEIIEIYWVPDLKSRLISIGQLANSGMEVHVNGRGMRVSKAGRTVIEVEKPVHETTYKLDIGKALMVRKGIVKCSTRTLMDWHKSMGHLNPTDVKRIIENKVVEGAALSPSEENTNCEDCLVARGNREPHDREAEREPENVAELISGDLLVTGQGEAGMDGESFALVMTDHYSGYTRVWPIHAKTAKVVTEKIVEFVELLENHTGQKTKYLRTDGGTEFVNDTLDKYTATKGIKREVTAPGDSKGNGRSERMNRTLRESARCMLAGTNLDESYWTWAIRTAAYVHNLTGKSPFVPDKTPYELIFGLKPNVSKLRPFGSKCYVRKIKSRQWETGAEIATLLGYDDAAEVYVVQTKGGIVKSRDVKFEVPPPPSELRRSERIAERKHYIAALAKSDEGNDEPTLDEALSGEYAEEWKSAIGLEMDNMLQQGVMEPVTDPKKRPIDTKLILKIKRDSTGNITKRKARLVAKGYRQVFGRDYTDTYAPVSRGSTVRALLATACIKKLKVFHSDIDCAYLNAPLKEEIYVNIPSLDGGQKTTYRLHKALYGLKQAGHAWYNTLKAIMQKYGWQRCRSDSCLFKRRRNGQEQFMAVYVDDLVIVAKSEDDYLEIMGDLEKHFGTKRMGEVKDLLGMSVRWCGNAFHLSQSGLITKLLNEFAGELNITPTKIPVKAGLVPYTGKATDGQRRRYLQCLGTIGHLAQWTRPDISAAHSLAARYCQNPGPDHFQALGQILGYLLYTKDYELKIGGGTSTVTVHTDSDWAGDDNDRKSQSGFATRIGDSLVSWKSGKQKTVARSTMEAEYIAVADGLADAIHVAQIARDLGLSPPEIEIYCDNQAAIATAKNPTQQSRAKHIDTSYHFIRDWVESGKAKIEYVKSKENMADVMTKGLPRPGHSWCTGSMNVGPWGSIE